MGQVHKLPGLLHLDPLRLFHNLRPRTTRLVVVVLLLLGLEQVPRPPPVLVRRDHSRQDSVYRLKVGASPSVHIHSTCQDVQVPSGSKYIPAHVLQRLTGLGSVSYREQC